MPARTPLFRLVTRALARAHAATVVRPASGDSDLRRTPPLSRRSFLATSAAAAAGLAVGCSGQRRPAPRPEPVIVVGAGLAGLTAAYRLRGEGVPVRLIEAQERVGGRIWSLRDRFADGQVVELGGELVDSDHGRIRRLALDLGLEFDDYADDDPSLAQDVYYFGGARRSEAELVRAFRPVAERLARDLSLLLPYGEVSYRNPGGSFLDRLTLEEWLVLSGADPWVQDLLAVAYVGEYGLAAGEQSALNLITLIAPVAPPFRVFGDSDERYHLRGGNDRLTSALGERLADSLETGTVLEALRLRPDGWPSLTVRRGESVREIAAPHLLLALPFTLLRQVELDLDLPEVKRRAIDTLGYGTNSKLMIGFAERPWRSRHRSNGSVLSDLPFQMTWETSRLQPGGAGVLTNFTGGAAGLAVARGTAGERAAEVVGQLEAVFPGLAAARAGATEVRFAWPEFRWARGSYSCYRPGQWTGIGGAEGERVGRIHFAGEHCSRDYQGFMEGAAETGWAAAGEILVDQGLIEPPRRRRRRRRAA